MTTIREVKPIEYHDTLPFITGVHYARRIPCIQYAYGLFKGGKLTGCITYGQPASPSLCVGVAGPDHRKDVIELNRLVITDTEKNDASYLVSHSLRLLPQGMFVISYADIEGWGHVGKVYQACHFIYTGQTKSRTDKKTGNGHSRHYAKGETERQYRTSKYRYVYITGTENLRKKLIHQMKYPVIPEYPKGESTRYDTDNPVPLRSNILE